MEYYSSISSVTFINCKIVWFFCFSQISRSVGIICTYNAQFTDAFGLESLKPSHSQIAVIRICRVRTMLRCHVVTFNDRLMSDDCHPNEVNISISSDQNILKSRTMTIHDIRIARRCSVTIFSLVINDLSQSK